MTDKQIEGYRQEVVDIQGMPDSEQGKRYEALRDLALRVGASTLSTYHQRPAIEGELADNIHQALQTATMVNMSKTAAENYKIAVTASKAAIRSMWAAWAAVVGTVLIAVFGR